MRVILITSAQTVQGVVVVNDEDADRVKRQMDRINEGHPRADQCLIEVFAPDTVDTALDYLATV